MKKRLLFLDIDGVVNTVMIYKEKLRETMIEKDGYWIDLGYPSTKHVSNTQALTWVEKLCREYNLDIVISSTWCIGHSLKELRECLYSSGLSKDINIIGVCRSNNYIRGQAIEAYFYDKDYKSEDCIMIILDDDKDMIGIKHDYTKYLVQTDTYTGFTMKDYEKACEMLEKQIDLEVYDKWLEEKLN